MSIRTEFKLVCDNCGKAKRLKDELYHTHRILDGWERCGDGYGNEYHFCPQCQAENPKDVAAMREHMATD